MTMTREQILESLGDPAELVRRLKSYQKSRARLADTDVREQYRDRWVAAYEGKVIADSEAFDTLLRDVDAMGVPRGQVAVEFMSDDDTPMIL